jgi:hypothetical protein
MDLDLIFEPNLKFLEFEKKIKTKTISLEIKKTSFKPTLGKPTTIFSKCQKQVSTNIRFDPFNQMII